MAALAVVEDVVLWLSVYVYRIVVVLSLIMHLILAFFSESRRRDYNYYGRGKPFLWVAYQLTEWAPAFVIANLYLETSPQSKMMVAFWVPFLLLHQARPDNMSAYAMEDSELWDRNMLFVVLEILGSGSVLYRFILADSDSSSTAGLLRPASCILMFLGMFKYLESAEALRRCNLGIMARSFKQQQRPKCIISRSSSSESNLDGDDDDEELAALLVAHDLFQICKGAFCDYTADTELRRAARSKFVGRWDSMCTVVEMELSLMYDILYTKAAVVHTWGGYAIRLASPALTATALLLFGLHGKEGMVGVQEVDTPITYVLLLTTFLLDVRWLFRSLASAWTHSFFNRMMPCNWLKHEFWCRDRWKKLRGFVVSLRLSEDKEPKSRSYRRWAGKMGQRNMFHKCTSAGNRRRTSHSIPSRESSADDLVDSDSEQDHHSSSRSSGVVEVPDYVKRLMFSNICDGLFPKPTEATTDTESGSATSSGPSDDDNNKEQSRGSCIPGSLLYEEGVCPSPSPCSGCRERIDSDHEQTCMDINHLPPPLSSDNANLINDEVQTEQTCTSINIQPPPFPPRPGPCQIRIGMRLGDQNRHDASSWPYTHPAGEQVTEHRWRYDYDQQLLQAPPEAYEQQADEQWIYHQNRYTPRGGESERNSGPGGGGGGDEEFPPELQEVILIWHIATNIFLSLFSPSISITGEDSKKHETAIKIMSNYMVFLVATRPEMLPGLKLRSLYRDTMADLANIQVAHNKAAANNTNQKTRSSSSYSDTSEEEAAELARWMPDNMKPLPDEGPAGSTDIIWEGTRLARVLLSLVVSKNNAQPTPAMVLHTGEVTGTENKLSWWTPKLKNHTRGDMDLILEFIFDSWVRLLLYTSIRCSRDSHAKQLSCGSELTTLVWIIAEHAEHHVIKKHLYSLFPTKLYMTRL